MIPATNATSSNNLLLDSEVNDVQETMSQFLSKITLAQNRGDEWVETSPEIISLVCRSGLGDKKYFTYGNPGVKVCAYGQREAIEEAENVQLGQVTHGPDEGVVIRG